nr:HNH endonuclease signature motif containing protein [Helcobacillus sp. ACRRO]
MLEHLRTRNPVCAFPGCSKRTHKVSEADHIIEFDHEDPHRGGRTELDNLHLLCRRHHQLKTAKHCRPSRRAESRRHPSAGSGITDWDLGGGVRVSVPQDRDLLTAAFTTTMWKAWEAEQYRTGKKIGPVPPPPKPPESRTPEQPERHAPAEENSEAEPTEEAKKNKPAKPRDPTKPTEEATPTKRARRTPVPPEELGPPPF